MKNIRIAYGYQDHLLLNMPTLFLTLLYMAAQFPVQIGVYLMIMWVFCSNM